MFNHGKNRFSLLYLLIAVFLFCAFAIRTVLLVKSWTLIDFGLIQVFEIYFVGFLYDFIAALYYVIPFVLYLTILPDRLFNNKCHRAFLLLFIFGLIYSFVFSMFSEWFFWDEFGKRFNFIAVDYLVYTREVIHNILESYPIPLLLAAVFVIAFLIFVFCYKMTSVFHLAFTYSSNCFQRLKVGIVFILLPILFFNIFNEQGFTNISSNQYNNELAKNGLYSLFSAFRNNTLNYDEFYARKDTTAVFDRLKKALKTGNCEFTGREPRSIARIIKNKGAEQKPNIMLIMVESLSAKYMGIFGDIHELTPNLDKLAGKSLFFNNLYATGTRTVRGMEAVTMSVPPTPGRSIVKRPDCHNMFSVGFITRQKGYENKFIYAGYGYFDNMNDYFSNNGFEIVDRKNLSKEEITFSTIWGACDEDLFNKTLKESDKSYKKHKPFFNFIMTTSNHRPYAYPGGRIDIPSHTGRRGAVKYTDYAINKFLSDALSKPWFDDTVFIIVADHNGNSSGKNELPVWRYKIPCIFYAPKIIAPGVVSKLCSQIDIMPTLFALLHWDYKSGFYGQNVLNDDFKQRAFIGNYEQLGFMRDGNLLVLQSDKSVHEYRIKHQTLYGAEYRVIDPIKKDVMDAITYYQSAGYLYKNRLDRWVEQGG